MESARTSQVPDEDRTARARIRDAAIARFAEEGVAGTSLKTIAADVGVSAPLVVHHFGSKEGLRDACDKYVAAAIRERKVVALRGGVDPLSVLRDAQQGPPLLGYLARTLADGSAHVGELVDELAEDAVAYMAEGVENGLLRPTEHPRARAVVLLMWQLGALVLHEHVERLLGVDLTGPTPDLLAWMAPAGEILTKGVLDERFAEQWRDAARALASEQD